MRKNGYMGIVAIVIAGFAAVVAAGLFGSCAGTDVVARVAKSSFTAMLGASGSRAAFDTGDKAWKLASSQGDIVAFAAEGGSPDAAFNLDLSPFAAAGLDPAKLVSAEGVSYRAADGRLLIGFDFGDGKGGAKAGSGFADAFARIVDTRRTRIGYHQALDHYGITLGGGFMFEWAKDLAKNDKDIVWVLNPEPFIAAGADPAKIPGWLYADVRMMDAAGKPMTVKKLLRPYDLGA